MRILTIAIAASMIGQAAPATAQAPQPVTRASVASQLDAGFAAADTNHDGSLNLAEMQALETKEAQQVVAALRARAQAQFKQLDTNKDGQLSFQEFSATVPTIRANETPAQLLQSYDTNRDGKVSAAEFRAPRLAKFDKFDANHDGIVTPAEEAAGNKK